MKLTEEQKKIINKNIFLGINNLLTYLNVKANNICPGQKSNENCENYGCCQEHYADVIAKKIVKEIEEVEK